MTTKSIKPTACLPEHLAALFMATAKDASSADLDIISLLSQMAMGTDADLAKQATASLYKQIILPLCDDFTSHGVEIANRVLITMIQAFCCTLKGDKTRQLLAEFNLTDQESFLARYKELNLLRPLGHRARHAVKKVFILSRVTLGADIAITSLIIKQTQKALPEAEIFLVGPEHLRHLFYDERLRYLDFSYNRDGSFLEKMAICPSLFQRIARETEELTPEEMILFDPDSRLSQLGLLPLTYTSSTYYLCTRQDRDKPLSLSQITQTWLEQIFPDITPATPHFCLHPEPLARCQAFLRHLTPPPFMITITFGVGNDDNKRLLSPFEKELLLNLLQEPDTLVILDSGRGGEEEESAKSLMAKIAERGYNTAELTEKELAVANIPFQHGLLRFKGRIDAMAALISASNLFIGYDSCGQHVATATETPSIICFTGAPNKRFLERWQPANHHGKTTNFIIDPKPVSQEQRAELIRKIVNTASHYRL